MRRVAAILLAATIASGCFAMDEIDEGQKIMDQHYGQAKKAQEPAEKEQGEPDGGGPGLVARVKGWWKGLQEKSAEATEDESPPPHPDNVLVRCDLDGSTHFMRKFDCQLRGGTYSEIDKSATR
jgi:hypothetical protein